MHDNFAARSHRRSACGGGTAVASMLEALAQSSDGKKLLSTFAAGKDDQAG